jgi:hypothetical protein
VKSENIGSASGWESISETIDDLGVKEFAEKKKEYEKIILR